MATALSWCIDNSSALIRDQTPQARKSLELAWLRTKRSCAEPMTGAASLSLSTKSHLQPITPGLWCVLECPCECICHFHTLCMHFYSCYAASIRFAARARARFGLWPTSDVTSLLSHLILTGVQDVCKTYLVCQNSIHTVSDPKAKQSSCLQSSCLLGLLVERQSLSSGQGIRLSTRVSG